MSSYLPIIKAIFILLFPIYFIKSTEASPTRMEYYQDDWDNSSHKPEKSLKVIIVGAGIAGLATGIGTFTQKECHEPSSELSARTQALWA